MKATSKILTTFAIAALSLSAGAKITAGKAYGDWKGLCVENQCGVEQVATNNNNPIGRIFLTRVAEENNMIFAFLSVPQGVNLLAGLKVSVDGTEINRFPYAFCIDKSCNAVPIPVAGDVMNKFKAGSKLQVEIHVGTNPQNMTFSLKGATAAINDL